LPGLSFIEWRESAIKEAMAKALRQPASDSLAGALFAALR